MIHTAEYYIKNCYGWSDIELKMHEAISKDIAIKAINKARIEAIKECGRVAKELLDEVEGVDFGIPQEFEKIIDQIK